MGGLQNFNQRSPFGPNWSWVWPLKSPLVGNDAFIINGHTPDLRLVSMDGRTPDEVVTIGADDWHIIPMHRKTLREAYTNVTTGGSAPNNDSGLMGFAYKEIP